MAFSSLCPESIV